MNSQIPPRHTDKKKGRNYFTIFFLIFAFLLAACAGAYFASSTSLFDKPKDEKEKPKVTETRMTARDKTTVMIMGIDQRADDVGRSDTLMVATLDPKKDKVALLSIPRDTRVKIKGNGYDKINAAYAYGGLKLAQNTVENFLGVSMDHYIMVDVKAFQRIIDAIGGIDIDVEKRMYYEDPWDDDGGLVIDLYPGIQHMDGKTAVTYVRYRDEEGDIGRIKRQQSFMKAILNKVASPTIITSLPAIMKEVFYAVQTDLTLKQMLEFATSLGDAQKNGLTAEMVDGKPMYIDGISYWIPNVKKLRNTVADTLDVTITGEYQSAFEEDFREYEKSIPSSATTIDIKEYNRRSSSDEEDEADKKRITSNQKKQEETDSKKNASKESSNNGSTPTTENEVVIYRPKDNNTSKQDTQESSTKSDTQENSTKLNNTQNNQRLIENNTQNEEVNSNTSPTPPTPNSTIGKSN